MTKKTRAVKELEDNLRTTKTETDSTSRAEREIVDEGGEQDELQRDGRRNLSATEAYQDRRHADSRAATARRSRQDTKKNFREAVLEERPGIPSAEPHGGRDDRRARRPRTTTYHEIQNPNDELTVTYLFYELQRTYRISEKIHQLMPVVLVANEVPAPDEIDDAWLMQARLDPAPRDSRRLVPSRARLPHQELRRRRDQHPGPREQRHRRKADRRRLKPADPDAERRRSRPTSEDLLEKADRAGSATSSRPRASSTP